MAWINIETTDLDPANSFPLEIAVIVTDENLEPIGELTRVIYQPAENLARISDFAREMHTENGLLNEVSGGKSTSEVEHDLLAFLDSYHWSKSGGIPRIKVAGTNPSFDVAWIQKFFPKLYPKLDHHLFDVIPLREAFQLITRYKADRSFGRRAIDEVRLSIAEWQTMRNLLGSPQNVREAAWLRAREQNTYQDGQTRNYYDATVDRYDRKTKALDLTGIQNEFLALLPDPKTRPVRILSAGCGPANRDEVRFLKAGFQVDAYDASGQMIAKAKENMEPLGGKAWQSSFIEFRKHASDRQGYDGIWAMSSLLHAHLEDLPQILEAHVAALNVGGVMLMSFLHGEGESFSENASPHSRNRIWTKFTAKSLQDFLKAHLPNVDIVFSRERVTGAQGFEIIWTEAVIRRVK